MANWDPAQYLKFAAERTQPAADLVSRIRIAAPQNVIDIGCGAGSSTRILRERWPEARIVGLDNSPQMIAQARRDFPEGEWRLADAVAFAEDARYDVVFSNAALQWVGDYEALLPRLMRAVAPGGCLAAQVPANTDSPLHRALLSVAGSAKWAALTGSCNAMLHYRTAEQLYEILCNLGRVDLWETKYYHILRYHQDLIEWYRGTGLRPFLEKLPDDRARAEFEGAVLRRCRRHYPPQSNGEVLFPFRRLFFVVYR